MTDAENHEFTWTSGHISIRIGVTFKPKTRLHDRLEIWAIEPEKARLPITKSGYSSRAMKGGAVAKLGGPVAATRKLLNRAAKGARWRKYLFDSRQLSLF